MASEKIRVALIYGGRSGEHEISLQSAASVMRNLDPAKYEVIPISIDPEGHWRVNDKTSLGKTSKVLPVFKNNPEVLLAPFPQESSMRSLVPITGALPEINRATGFDVIFPVMHGPLCEDGSIQGLFELADVAYVGSGVLASAVGMDKDIAKRLVAAAGLPIVPYIALKKPGWENNFVSIEHEVARRFGYPVFVKPANMGSSIGISKVHDQKALQHSLELAFQYDEKALIEKAIHAREIEYALLEHEDPYQPTRVSVAGEIIPTHEFYSYEAKYLDENGAKLLIPAELTESQKNESSELARRVFQTLECEGMARVDFFLDKETGEFLFSEVNTIPGFTVISMYPKLWEASGISYQELIDKLLSLAIARHKRRKKLVRVWKGK